MTKSELLDKIKRAEKNPLIDASLKASLLKKYNAQLAELEKEEPKKETATKKNDLSDIKVPDDVKKVFLEHEDEFKNYTFSDFKEDFIKARKGKVFTKDDTDWQVYGYVMTKAHEKDDKNLSVGDNVSVIMRGSRVYGKIVDKKGNKSVVRLDVYGDVSFDNNELSFAKKEASDKKETSKNKTDDLSSVRVIANEMAKNAGFKSAKVDDLGNEAYLIEISPSTEENKMAGMVLNKYKDGTFEVAEMQAGKGGNFINVFGEYKTLKPALTQLLKGNKQKPIKVIDMRSDSEKSENKKEPSAKYKVGDILWHDTKHKGEFKKVIIDAVTGFTGDGHRYDVEFVDDEDKRINKFAKSYDDLLSKTKPKSEDKKETKSEETEEERCQKIIRDAKAASKKARESAKKSAKKPEVTKAKERIERTYEIIENKIEKGSLTKAEVAKLIVETKEVLKMLEKALKSL